MDNLNNPSDPFAGEFEFGSSDGAENVTDSGLTLAELNKTLGREYKDKSTALSALKETYAMVGKAGQIVNENKKLKDAAQSSNSDARLKEIEAELFYSNNPQYKPYRDTINAMGGNPSEVVEKDAFKKVFDGLTELEQTRNKKSVLESNPRIGQAKTKLDEARDLSAHGKQVDANLLAVDAVIAAYE